MKTFKGWALAFLISSVALTACTENTRHTTTSELRSETDPSPVFVFTPPPGWTKSAKGSLTVFTAKEGDANIVIGTIDDAQNEEEAARRVWKMFDPEFSRDIRVNSPGDIYGGWERIRNIEYITSPNEQQIMFAITHQNEGQWQVVIVTGSNATLYKRSAEFNEFIQSFVKADYAQEDLTTRQAKQLTEDDIAELLKFAEQGLESLKIPGAGIALVQNGKVIYSGGIGVEDINTKKPVTEDSVFMIASNTKGMTTLLLAKLVELGKIGWDDQVISHYPQFKLGDKATTESVLIKHLVCACTGLPRKDYPWFFKNTGDTPVSVTFENLANTAPTSEFGEVFQYNNQMAAAAGYIAGHILYPEMKLGEAYDRAMQELIFDPLDMHNTTFSFEEAYAIGVATPHELSVNEEIVIIEQSITNGFNHLIVPYRPAGAAWSTSADMIKYVYNELSGGVAPDGTRLFAEAPLMKRREPFVKTGERERYGMGLWNETIGGIEVVTHGGSMAGYQSNFFALPGAQTGAVVLTNSESGYNLLQPFLRKLIEILYDAEPLAQSQVDVAVETNRLYLKTFRNEFVYPPSKDIDDRLADTYISDDLGELKIIKEHNRVFLDQGVWKAEVATKVNQDGSNALFVIGAGLLSLEFVIGEEEGVSVLTLSDGQHNYTFRAVSQPNDSGS
ncbi:serine hydrolase [Aestuariibacter sp. A3R04]|uniref:serine hydrolase domain-containing protein n=1 Tax=Aestuariibacter sp. A3R04 TaxID=2841571 RepID=UPI001C094DDD|nr:serine hydrolase domain-containing protein [Aestuariibacter sp. A3R04]MBU3021614.1 beta-lactamase family protein [Aestuariibacter sp. A3R04]